jgi:hypothetical protein
MDLIKGQCQYKIVNTNSVNWLYKAFQKSTYCTIRQLKAKNIHN